MTRVETLGKLCQCVVFSTLLFLISVDDTSARGWTLGYRQDIYVTAHLQRYQVGEPSAVCERGFRPVSLDTQIDLNKIGRLGLGTSSPEHYQSTAIDTARVRRNLKLRLDISVQGCAFRSHFVPNTGYAELSGMFGPVAIKRSRFPYVDGENDSIFRVSYIAQLSGPIDRTRGWRQGELALPELDVSDTTIGVLNLWMDRGPYFFLTDEFAEDAVFLRFYQIRIIVLADQSN